MAAIISRLTTGSTEQLQSTHNSMSTAPWYSRWIIRGAIVRGDQKPAQLLPRYEARSKEVPAVSEISHCEKRAASTRPNKKEWAMLVEYPVIA